jgi:hypothetical protein
LIREVADVHRLGLIIDLLVGNRSLQKGNMHNTVETEYPKIPHSFGCYVCGSVFETNQERLVHLEKLKHIDLYSTGSPQEIEEVHRLSL